ncbi:hypothetical protein [Protaetiibacter intestinalis]|uniref:Uncharacterized protein n=1 Tax=Protaetiibacter intestinalis TaxID=2419774 RepID=A0A387BDM7_9MICO|nr:hypothetical protein [Protaetiibacter intestinalis]AYF99156.1 hypothetical protein D7I47_13430 [Protaetiibacter intestinalis]
MDIRADLAFTASRPSERELAVAAERARLAAARTEADASAAARRPLRARFGFLARPHHAVTR